MTPGDISTLVDAFYDGLLGSCPPQQPLDLLRVGLNAGQTTFTYKRHFLAPDQITISSEDSSYLSWDESHTECHTAGAQGRCEDGGTFSVRAIRRRGAPPFEHGEADLLAALVPHIKRALGLSSRVQVSQWERQLYSGVLDRLKVGALILDEQGALLQATRLAKDLIDEMDGLQLVSGHVHAVASSEDKQLQSLIKTVLSAPDRSKVRPRALSISRQSGLRDLGLVVQSVCAASSYPSIAVAIFLRASDQGAEVEYEILRQLFDLTPAEASVASRLAEGLSLDEAATDLNISLNTVRAHLRSIFSKNGITRQTHLVRMLLNSAAVLGTRSNAIMLDH